MSLKSPTQYHNTWPTAATPTDLPNVLGAATQDAALEVGDLALVTSAGQQYRCRDATLGAAYWSPVDPGTYVIGGLNQTVKFGDPETVLGEFTFDAGLVEPIPVVFRSTLTTTAAGANTCLVKLYDVGPAAGPPAAPVLLATITSNAAGGEGPLRRQSAAFTWHDTVPNAGVMVRAERVYRVTAEMTVGGAGEQIHIGRADVYVGS